MQTKWRSALQQAVSFGSSEWVRIHTGRSVFTQKSRKQSWQNGSESGIRSVLPTVSGQVSFQAVRQYKFTSGRKVDSISRESGRISVREAAKLLGVSPQFIRIGMQRGTLPIGAAVKMSSRWTYWISRDKVERFIENAACAATQTAKEKCADESAERTR